MITADFPFLPKTARHTGNSGLFLSGSEARGLLASATQKKTLPSISLPSPGVVSPLLLRLFDEASEKFLITQSIQAFEIGVLQRSGVFQ